MTSVTDDRIDLKVVVSQLFQEISLVTVFRRLNCKRDRGSLQALRRGGDLNTIGD